MSDLVGKRLGQYEITGIIGKGGMAVVYKARQPSMDRDVAIKVISGQLADDEEFIPRFEREARLIAHLQHVHILPVYDFGREEHLLYLVMRLVEGGSLERRLHDGPLPPAQTAHLFSQIASALGYAHREGIVHRDVKPSNILLDKHGDPYLMDFGIAKMLQGGSSLTATGVVVGTPSFMAPEQWRGGDIDARTDIYALGVMLFEMLTGMLPFQGDTPSSLMYKHLDEPPPLPGSLNPALASIDGVISRALAKNPEDRFSSTALMVEALDNAVAGLATPILAAPHTLPLAPAAGGQPATGDAPASPTMPAPTHQARLPETMPAARPAKRFLPVMAALAVLVLLVIAGTLYLSTRPAYREVMRLDGHQDWVNDVAWHPAGDKLASAGNDQTVRIWNAATGESLAVLRGHTGSIYALAWSPDGNSLASAGEDRTIRIWDPVSRVPIATLVSESGEIYHLAWSPDSKKLAAGSADGTVQIWEPTSKKLLSAQQTQANQFAPVAWSPDGNRLATTAKDYAIQVWDAATGRTLTSFPAHTKPIYAIRWNQDGSRLASASLDGTVRIWDMRDMPARQPLPLMAIQAHGNGVSAVAWTPSGSRLATSSGFIYLGGTNDPSIRIWDAETGQLIITLEGQTQPVKRLAWSPDGARLASAGLDGTVRIWGN